MNVNSEKTLNFNDQKVANSKDKRIRWLLLLFINLLCSDRLAKINLFFISKEIENSKTLHARIEMQDCELLKCRQKIASISSKMVAVREIISRDFDDDNVNNNNVDATTSPIIVKVESVHSETITEPVNDTNMVTPLLRINTCGECDKKFSSSQKLKRHMVLHQPPSFPCSSCASKFVRIDYLQRHIRKVHNGSTVGKIKPTVVERRQSQRISLR